MSDKFVWELIDRQDFGDTHRMRITGGWLYRNREWDSRSQESLNVAVALCFAPDPTG